MASQLCRLKCLLGNNLIISKYTHRFSSHARTTVLPNGVANRVVVTNDGATIVCWHPEPNFPYECSRPLPETVTHSDSMLNVDSTSAYTAFGKKSDEVVRQELMKITHTTKHRWFPRSRDKFVKRIRPDREYL